MDKCVVRYKKVRSTAQVPTCNDPNDTGYDIYAALDQSVKLNPGCWICIPTGLVFELPKGWGVSIRPRSGLALKSGITVLNTPGTIDNKYRDEIGVVIINHSNTAVEIKPGDRIAQFVAEKVNQMKFIEAQEISKEEDRGGGFGSSGQ